MLFFVIRFIIIGILFAINMFFVNKSRNTQKRKIKVVSFFIAIVLLALSTFIPIENTMIAFPTPEMVYKYINPGDFRLVVDGEKTSLVIGEKNDSYIVGIFPRENNGWKIGLGLNTRRVSQITADDTLIYLYQYKNTQEFYVVISDKNGEAIDIKDNNHSEFHCLKRTNRKNDRCYYTYSAYLGDFDENYFLVIDDETFRLTQALVPNQ